MSLICNRTSIYLARFIYDSTELFGIPYLRLWGMYVEAARWLEGKK